jgi:hypothetical protein
MDAELHRRLQGFRELLHDGVEIGSRLVERHHREAAAKPFRVLAAIPGIAGPAMAVRTIHDAVLTVTYGGIRVVNRGFRAGSSRLLRLRMPGRGAAIHRRPSRS